MKNLTPLVKRMRDALVSEDSAKTNVMKISSDFGRAFRAERQARNITLREMAEMLEIGKSMLDCMEGGDRLWTVERAEKAVAIFARLKPIVIMRPRRIGKSAVRAIG
jgi:ribosome-binding protein aMBF1 (putative translation factor)